MWTVSVIVALVVLCGTLTKISASCPQECRCPHEVPRCAPGASLVLDSCGCCEVCAGQLNEDCNKTSPCDHTKGLECNYGAGYTTAKGICRAKTDGRPCEYNEKIYQNGESFRPNCKHQCTCMDGAVGCVSLCPRELRLPRLVCAKPQLVKRPGRCCGELLCSTGPTGNSLIEKVIMNRKEEGRPEDDLAVENELGPVSGAGHGSLPGFNNEPVGNILSEERKCVLHTSAWSPCSKSCGMGVSSRTTNSNTRCKLVKETRLCEVRPCTESAVTKVKKGQTCRPVEKARQPVKLSYAGCRSLKKFRPRYCGLCWEGQCCHPQQTQTVSVQFRCQDHVTFTRNVMMIHSCKCEPKCPWNSSKEPADFHRLLNHIQRLRE